MSTIQAVNAIPGRTYILTSSLRYRVVQVEILATLRCPVCGRSAVVHASKAHSCKTHSCKTPGCKGKTEVLEQARQFIPALICGRETVLLLLADRELTEIEDKQVFSKVKEGETVLQIQAPAPVPAPKPKAAKAPVRVKKEKRRG